MIADKKILTTGNEAIAEAAIQAGCRFYAGYPITPQNEICAYMAARMPEVGGTFIQSESEIAAINMVFGALVTGARAMTSSSSPGISLKQEGISYLAACQLPARSATAQRDRPAACRVPGNVCSQPGCPSRIPRDTELGRDPSATRCPSALLHRVGNRSRHFNGQHRDGRSEPLRRSSCRPAHVHDPAHLRRQRGEPVGADNHQVQSADILKFSGYQDI